MPSWPLSRFRRRPPGAQAAGRRLPALAHRELLGGEFWRRIPAYANVSEAEFLDHKWQAKHSITNIRKLLATLEGLVSEGSSRTPQRGFERAPMSVRVSPYLLSLIDWSNPTRIRCACSSSRSARASCPIIRGSTSIRCTSAPTCRCPG